MIGMLVVLFAKTDDIAADVSVADALTSVALLVVALVTATAMRWRIATSVPGAVTVELAETFR